MTESTVHEVPAAGSEIVVGLLGLSATVIVIGAIVFALVWWKRRHER